MTDATKRPYYVTTAILYANASPHVGHTFELIGADVMARAKRMLGYDVFFQTGTDEHGQKMLEYAERANKDPKAYADEVAPRHRELWDALHISYDRFIRTTDSDHYAAVERFWQASAANGDIYKDKYEGWYCVTDENFVLESQAIHQELDKPMAIDVDQTVDESFVRKFQLDEYTADGMQHFRLVCPQCGRELIWKSEESYFFRWSKYQDFVEQWLRDHPRFIEPRFRANEMVNSFLKPGLQDISISRSSIKWGIPVPGDPDHVIYVWFDALINYITGVGYGTDPARFEHFWPADLHIVGKDILKFHTLLWPAMCKSVGIQPPQHVFGHGFVSNKSQKPSELETYNIIDSTLEFWVSKNVIDSDQNLSQIYVTRGQELVARNEVTEVQSSLRTFLMGLDFSEFFSLLQKEEACIGIQFEREAPIIKIKVRAGSQPAAITRAKEFACPDYNSIQIDLLELFGLQIAAKMSKSRGNIVDPVEVTARHGGNPDPLRFFLLREIDFGGDGIYSDEALDATYNADLADKLGNLLSRTLTMVEKYQNGIVTEPASYTEEDDAVRDTLRALFLAADNPDAAPGTPLHVPGQPVYTLYEMLLDQCKFSLILDRLMAGAQRLNLYITETKPFTLAKDPEQAGRLRGILYVLVEGLRILAVQLYPFVPGTAEKIWQQTGGEGSIGDVPFEALRNWGYLQDVRITRGENLFPKEQK